MTERVGGAGRRRRAGGARASEGQPGDADRRDRVRPVGADPAARGGSGHDALGDTSAADERVVRRPVTVREQAVRPRPVARYVGCRDL